jgi:hypothetical protein
MTLRTSAASWLTLVPTSPAPMRMTMLLGSRAEAWPAESTCGLLAPTCVLFFVRLRAILGNVRIGGLNQLVLKPGGDDGTAALR